MQEQRLYSVIGTVCTVVITIPVVLRLVEEWRERRAQDWEEYYEEQDTTVDPFAPSAADMRSLHDFTR